MRKIILGLVLCAVLPACVTRYETRVQAPPGAYAAPPMQQGYGAPAPKGDGDRDKPKRDKSRRQRNRRHGRPR